jgi:Mn2+/Fe2+ NRAMP family transporter
MPKSKKNSIKKIPKPLLVKDIEKGIRSSVRQERRLGSLIKKDGRRTARFLHLSHGYKKRRGIGDFFRLAKSGTITGAADNDPAGIVTYTQVGASTGFSQLWLMLLSLPMLGVIEEMSARVGVVTKKGLGRIIQQNYGIKVALVVAGLVAIANILTIGADLAAVAEVFGIMSGASSILFLIAVTLVIAYFLVRKNYKIVSRYLFIITPIFFLYVASGILVEPDWGEVIRSTLIPVIKIDLNYWVLAVGLLGTTISPYLIFWQTTEEIEEHRGMAEMKKEAKGVWLGMAFNHFIFFFIIIASAAVLFGGDKLLSSAGEAALALQPVAGDWALLFYGLGIIGAGIIAVPVLAASTGYMLKDAMHWHGGLDVKDNRAKSFYAVIILSLMIGLAIALTNINPIKALIYSQVLNGILMPFLLVVLIMVCNNKKILGKFVNNFWSNLVVCLAVVVMVAFDLILVWRWLYGG